MDVIWLLAAAGWGAAEASFFFIVPDVMLTLAVLRLGALRAVQLAIVAALSAALTGAAMWLWAGYDPAGASAAMLQIPAVGRDLLTRVAWEFDHGWPLKLVFGAVTGVPYKLYAVEAGKRHIGLEGFLVISFCARLLRFLLTIGLGQAGQKALQFIGKPQLASPLWAVSWLIVYVVYFGLRANA